MGYYSLLTELSSLYAMIDEEDRLNRMWWIRERLLYIYGMNLLALANILEMMWNLVE